MRLLKNIKDINNLLEAVKRCKGDVLLRSVDGTEEFNLKSALSVYLGVARLCEEQGDNYEIFCDRVEDEAHLIQFFNDFYKNNPEQAPRFIGEE